MTGRIYRLLALSLLPMFFAACSSTVVDSSWKDPKFQSKVSKVYVIGVAKAETTRRIFEDEFGKLLQQKGATGISSYRDLTSPASTSKEQVARLMEKNGADSVIIVRMVNKRTEQVVNPGRAYTSASYNAAPYASNWGGYYGSSYTTIYEPPTVSNFVIATIEANLYDIKSGGLIWSAQLETTIDPNVQKLINDFAKVVVDDLVKQQLL